MPSGDEKIKVTIDVISRAEERFRTIEKTFSDMAKQITASVQQINRNFVGLQKELNTISGGFSKLNNKLDEVSSSFKKIRQPIEKTKRETSSLTDVVKGHHFAWRGLVWTVVRAEIVYRGIMRILGAFRDTLVDLTMNVDEYKNALIRVTALQTFSFQSFIKDTKDLTTVFNSLYAANQRIYSSIEELSIKTPLTAEQLLRLYQSFLATGQIVDLTSKKVREGLLGMANAVYLLTGGVQLSRQLFQEVRALVTGTGKAYGEVYKFIVATNPALAEQIEKWAATGEVVSHLSDVLKSFVIAGDKVQNTVQGLTTTIETEFRQAARNAFADAYDSIVAFLQVLRDSPEAKDVFVTSVKIMGKFVKWFLVLIRAAILDIQWFAIALKKFPDVFDVTMIKKMIDAYKSYLDDVNKILNPPKETLGRSAYSDIVADLMNVLRPAQAALTSFETVYQSAVDKTTTSTLKVIKTFGGLKTQLGLVEHTIVNVQKTMAEKLGQLAQIDFIKGNVRASIYIDFLKTVLSEGNLKQLSLILNLFQDTYNYLSKLSSPEAKEAANVVKQLWGMLSILSDKLQRAKHQFGAFSKTVKDRIDNEIVPVLQQWQYQINQIELGMKIPVYKDEVTQHLDMITNRYERLRDRLTVLYEKTVQKQKQLENTLQMKGLPEEARQKILIDLDKVHMKQQRILADLQKMSILMEQAKNSYLDFYFATQDRKIKLGIIELEKGEVAGRLAKLDEEFKKQLDLYRKYGRDTTNLERYYALQRLEIIGKVERQITDKALDEQQRQILLAKRWRDEQIKNLNAVRQYIKPGEYQRYFFLIEKGYRNILLHATFAYQVLQKATEQAARNMQDAMANFFFDTITGQMKSLTDFFRSFTHALLRIWSNMLAQMVWKTIAASRLIQSIKGAVGSLFSGLFGGGSASSSVLRGNITNSVLSPANYSLGDFSFANGGVLHGCFIPLKQFASGGIVDRPTLGLIGEGKYKEAVIPLPDGKHVPAIVKETEKPQPIVLNVNYHINALDSASFSQYLSRNKEALLAPLLEDLERNGALITSIRHNI